MITENKKKLLKIFGFSFLGVIILLTGILGYGAYQYNRMMTDVHNKLPDKNSEEQAGENDPESDNEVSNEEIQDSDAIQPFTIMISGVDTRGSEEHARSDTIMIAAVNPQKESVMLVSIPRDTYAYVDGVGCTKFNHSMAYGGPPLVNRTLENFLDIQVDHYVTIDFEGFRRVVNEVGGITVDVDRRMKYYDPADGTDIDLYPGEQELGGADALDYARFRLSDVGSASSDFDRIERQQEVIRKVIDKGNNIRNIFKVFSFMDIIGDHVRTDLTKKQIQTLASVFRDFQPEELNTASLNGEGARKLVQGNDLWVYVVTEQEKRRIHDRLSSYLKS